MCSVKCRLNSSFPRGHHLPLPCLLKRLLFPPWLVFGWSSLLHQTSPCCAPLFAHCLMLCRRSGCLGADFRCSFDLTPWSFPLPYGRSSLWRQQTPHTTFPSAKPCISLPWQWMHGFLQDRSFLSLVLVCAPTQDLATFLMLGVRMGPRHENLVFCIYQQHATGWKY